MDIGGGCFESDIALALESCSKSNDPKAPSVLDVLRETLDAAEARRDVAREAALRILGNVDELQRKQSESARHLRSVMEDVAVRSERLESRLDRVGRAANRLGGRLQKANREQYLAEEMAQVLGHLHTFGMPDALHALPPLFAEESRRTEAAKVANKLREVVEDLISEPGEETIHGQGRRTRKEIAFETLFSLSVAAENVQTYCHSLETTVLNRFEVALQSTDITSMRDCIETLQELKAEGGAIQRFISSRHVFAEHDPSPIAVSIHPAPTETAADDSPLEMQQFGGDRTSHVGEAQHFLKEEFAHLLDAAKEASVIASEVFSNPLDVMTSLVQKLLEQKVQAALEALLCQNDNAASDTRLNMMMTLMAYKETIDLASELQEICEPNTDMVWLADSLFGWHQEQYLIHEIKLLEEMGGKQLLLRETGPTRYRGSLIGGQSERLHCVSSGDLGQVVNWAKDAIDRCMEFFKLHQTILIHNVFEILRSLLNLAGVYLKDRVQRALQSCESASKAINRNQLRMQQDQGWVEQVPKKAQALVNEVAEPLLEAVNSCGTCMEILCNFLQEVVSPVVIGSAATHRQCQQALSSFTRAMEEEVRSALKVDISACGILFDKVLFLEQRREDFTPAKKSELEILEPTQACQFCLQIFIEIRKSAMLHLGEKNGTSFAAELSICLYNVVMSHIKRYHYNMAGAVQLKRDLSEYFRTMKELCMHQAVTFFETSASLTNLLLVGADIVPSVMDSIDMPRDEQLLYLQLRLDFKNVKTLLLTNREGVPASLE